MMGLKGLVGVEGVWYGVVCICMYVCMYLISRLRQWKRHFLGGLTSEFLDFRSFQSRRERSRDGGVI